MHSTTGGNEKNGRGIRLTSCVAIVCTLPACRLPFHIQPTSVYLATAARKTALSSQTEQPTDDDPNFRIATIGPSCNPAQAEALMARIVGSEHRFAVRRVRTGDTLGQYTQQYGTSEGVITRANDSLNLLLWENITMVIETP